MLLIVDDGKFEMQTIVEELELSGFEVVWKTDVDAALTFLKRNPQQIDLLILDIMMPAGRAFKDEDTQDGLRTGFHFYERARVMAPHLPIIMFTNFPSSPILHFAVSRALVAAFAMWLGWQLFPAHPFWIAMTILIVVVPDRQIATMRHHPTCNPILL